MIESIRLLKHILFMLWIKLCIFLMCKIDNTTVLNEISFHYKFIYENATRMVDGGGKQPNVLIHIIILCLLYIIQPYENIQMLLR